MEPGGATAPPAPPVATPLPLYKEELANHANGILDLDIGGSGGPETMEELDADHIFLRNTDTSDDKCQGIDDVEDLVGITKFGNQSYHAYGSLELECDEAADTIKCEPVENEAEATEVKVTEDVRENLKVTENKEYSDGSVKRDCDDETKFSEEMSVVNIVPIFEQELGTDTHDYNECQVVSHSVGRATSNKRIKLELVSRNTDAGSSPAGPPSWNDLPFALKELDFSCLKKCPACDVKFSERLGNSEEVVAHLMNHFPKLYTCRSCGQGFTRKDNHERHLAFHEDQKVHCCHICEKHLKLSDNFVVNFTNVSIHMHTHRITQEGRLPIPEVLSDYVKMNTTDSQAYTCNICGSAFPILSYLLIHLANHSYAGQHSCTICAKECLSEEDVNACMCRSHQGAVSTGKVKTFTRENYYFKNDTNDFGQKTKHRGDFYNCVKCYQGFTQLDNLQKHLVASHSGPKQHGYCCHICREVIDSDVNMKTHMKLHKTHFTDLSFSFNDQIKIQADKSGLFVCNLCSYSNARVRLLIRHLLKHVKGRWACQDCGNEYVTNSKLREHAKSHTSPAKESCVVCGEQFSIKTDFERHQISHYGALSTCPICEQQFYFPENLEKHKRAVHYGKSLHPCHACDVSLPVDELKGHIKQLHRVHISGVPEDLSSRIMTHSLHSAGPRSVALVCSICGAWFPNLNSILNHLRLHPKTKFDCCICGKEYVQEGLLTHHNMTHHNMTQQNMTQHNMTQHDMTQQNMAQHDMTQHDMTQHNMTQHNMTQHDMTQHNMTQHNMTQHNMTQHDMTQHNMTQHDMTQHNMTQHNMTQHNMTQHNMTQHNMTQHNMSQHDMTQHNMTQHNMTQHNMAQHNMTQRNMINQIMTHYIRTQHTNAENNDLHAERAKSDRPDAKINRDRLVFMEHSYCSPPD